MFLWWKIWFFLLIVAVYLSSLNILERETIKIQNREIRRYLFWNCKEILFLNLLLIVMIFIFSQKNNFSLILSSKRKYNYWNIFSIIELANYRLNCESAYKLLIYNVNMVKKKGCNFKISTFFSWSSLDFFGYANFVHSYFFGNKLIIERRLI